MKKILSLALIAACATGMAFANAISGSGDILGPHNVDGHGCASCHAPHNGAAQNAAGGDSTTGKTYLWGRSLIVNTYTMETGDTFTTKASYSETNDPQFHTAACLSCHDGSIKPAGMNGTSFEATQDGIHPNTWLATDGSGLQNDHPVDFPWDPTDTTFWPSTVDANGTITWTATTPNIDYGHPVRMYGSTANGGTAYVECSTCHNPHAISMARVTLGSGTKANKPTAFFIRGWYDDGNTASNSTQQFCRSCHYEKSNEYVGMTVPTT
jgi:hypothetical protein